MFSLFFSAVFVFVVFFFNFFQNRSKEPKLHTDNNDQSRIVQVCKNKWDDRALQLSSGIGKNLQDNRLATHLQWSGSFAKFEELGKKSSRPLGFCRVGHDRIRWVCTCWRGGEWEVAIWTLVKRCSHGMVDTDKGATVCVSGGDVKCPLMVSRCDAVGSFWQQQKVLKMPKSCFANSLNLFIKALLTE